MLSLLRQGKRLSVMSVITLDLSKTKATIIQYKISKND
jgi:hypothetical protein